MNSPQLGKGQKCTVGLLVHVYAALLTKRAGIPFHYNIYIMLPHLYTKFTVHLEVNFVFLSLIILFLQTYLFKALRF